MTKKTKRIRIKSRIGTPIRIGILFCSVVFGYLIFSHFLSKSPCNSIQNREEYKTLPRLGSKELAHYDGVENEKTYIGYHCLIYDVTEGKEQYYAQGKGYHYLVGRDATKQLEIFGGDIIENKYPVVGVLKQ